MYEWISTIHGMCDGAFRVVLVHLTRLLAANAVHTAPNSTVINRQFRQMWSVEIFVQFSMSLRHFQLMAGEN
jgi:hypothetical protein